MKFDIDYILKNNIKGAIFDMDGTLIDSMSTWPIIYQNLFSYLNIEVSQDFMMKANHLPMEKRVDELINEYNLKLSRDDILSYWVNMASFYYKNFKLKPHMEEVLDELKKYNIKMIIATASDKRLAKLYIKEKHLEEYFVDVISLNEVSRPKSFPDIYLKASERLNLRPNECIVYEDALIPLKSAKMGGFMTCAVKDSYSKIDENEILNISDLSLLFNEDIE